MPAVIAWSNVTLSPSVSSSCAARTVTVRAVFQSEPVKTSVSWLPGASPSVSTSTLAPPPPTVTVVAAGGALSRTIV